MNNMLTEKLTVKHPILYSPENAYCYYDSGFNCGDGWYNLIDVLSALIVTHSTSITEITEIKEEQGKLIVAIREGDNEQNPDFVDALCYMAELLSVSICEICGKRVSTYVCTCGMKHKSYDERISNTKNDLLPFSINGIGKMWVDMVKILHNNIDVYGSNRSNVEILSVNKQEEQLSLAISNVKDINFVNGMVVMLEAYTSIVDEETGDVLREFNSMHEKIIENLKSLEEKENIKILYACESGSRAWGFSSKDSDYDVRFIYVRPIEWYLRVDIEDCRDVVEQPINDLLDINGWDLKKALKLLRKSNPALIEWFNSPIVYNKNEQFTEDFQKLIMAHYSPRSCFFHYSHMANSNFREFLQGDTVRIKKYFYVLRPILAMQWIDQDRGIVPMGFAELVDELVHEPQLKLAIEKLLADKRKGFEKDYLPRIDVISEFIESELLHFKEKAQEQEKQETDFSLLNPFFEDVLTGEYS